MIIINFKNYTYGDKTVKLAKKIEKYLPKAIAAVPAVDIPGVASKTKLKVFAQHVDTTSGRATGFLLPETAKVVGARGTLLNHSEHPLSFKTLKQAVQRAHKAGLRVVLCAPSIKEAKKLMKLRPKAIAFEDKKLIGTGKSITEYRQDEVKKFASLFRKSPIIPLCGAGISSSKDITTAKKLGCKGVLIASAIAKNPTSKATEKLLKEISNNN
jgi:triosephosphate isomerase (TIM)